MPFRGTDKRAYSIASKGNTPAKRKKIYYEQKKNNECRQKLQQHNNFTLSRIKDKVNAYEKNVKNKPCTLSNSARRTVATNKQPKFVKPIVTKEPINKPIAEIQKTFQVNKSIVKSRKYIPRQLILDDIREFRSSKIISNISNELASFLMKTTLSRNISNYEKNVIRSTVAFVASEVINKALEKPLEFANNIKMFIKVGKAIYKVVVWFNEKTHVYDVKSKSMKKVSTLSREYRKFLIDNPKIQQAYKYPVNVKKLLGKVVEVIVDRPMGSIHSDIIYRLNYGHLLNNYANDSEGQKAYIMGVNEPVLEFKGQVIAIIQRLNDIEDKLVVAPIGNKYSYSEILAAVDFQEKDFKIKILIK